jgi:hypothetical protein
LRARLAGGAEADGHAVVGIHQADRDREIDQLLFLERRRGAASNASSGTPVSDTRVTVSAQASAARSRSLKEMHGFRPGLQQRELLDLHPLS